MEHLEEGTIHAWLDGELSDEEGGEIERHIADCASCSAAVAEARGFTALASRVLTSLDDVPRGVVPAVAAAAGSAAADDVAVARAHRQVAAARKRSWWRHPGLIAAAAVVFVAVGSFPVVRRWRTVEQASAPVAAVAEQGLPSAAPAPTDSLNARLDAVAQKATVAAGASPPAAREPSGGGAERKKEAASRLADAAPAPAPTITPTRADAPKTTSEQVVTSGAPLGRAAVRSDSAESRRSADELALARQRAPVASGVAGNAVGDVRAKAADVNRATAPAAPPRPAEAAAERERLERDNTVAPSLVGCYALRMVAVGGGPMTIAAVKFPTHIALDSMRVADGAVTEYEARDISPEPERVAGVYRWRPTGRGSFEVIVIRDGGTQRIAAVTGANPTAPSGPVTPMPAGSPVRLSATREACH